MVSNTCSEEAIGTIIIAYDLGLSELEHTFGLPHLGLKCAFALPITWLYGGNRTTEDAQAASLIERTAMNHGGPRPLQSNWGASIKTVRASAPYGADVSGRDLRDGVRLAQEVYGRKSDQAPVGGRVRVIRDAPSAHAQALARRDAERRIAGNIGNVE